MDVPSYLLESLPRSEIPLQYDLQKMSNPAAAPLFPDTPESSCEDHHARVPGSDTGEHEGSSWRSATTTSLPDRSPAASTTCPAAAIQQQHTPTSFQVVSGSFAHSSSQGHLALSAAEIIRGEQERRRRNRMASEKCRRRKIEKEEGLRERGAQLRKRLDEVRGELAAAEAERARVREVLNMHAAHGCPVGGPGEERAVGKMRPLVDTSQDRLVVQHHITTAGPAATRTYLTMQSPAQHFRPTTSVSLPSSPSALPRHVAAIDPRTAPRVQHTYAQVLTLAHTPPPSSTPLHGQSFAQAFLFSPEALLSPTRRARAASRELHEFFSPLPTVASGPHDALHAGQRAHLLDGGNSNNTAHHPFASRPHSHALGEALLTDRDSAQRLTPFALTNAQHLEAQQSLEPVAKDGVVISLDAFAPGDVSFSPLLPSHDHMTASRADHEHAAWLAHGAPGLTRQHDHIHGDDDGIGRHHAHSPGGSHGAKPYPRRPGDHAPPHAGTERGGGGGGEATAFISLPNLFGLADSAGPVDAPTLISPPAVAPRSLQSLYPAHEHLK